MFTLFYYRLCWVYKTSRRGGNNQKPLITKYFSARTPWYNRLFDPNFRQTKHLSHSQISISTFNCYLGTLVLHCTVQTEPITGCYFPRSPFFKNNCYMNLYKIYIYVYINFIHFDFVVVDPNFSIIIFEISDKMVSKFMTY